jgi:amidohydrolase
MAKIALENSLTLQLSYSQQHQKGIAIFIRNLNCNDMKEYSIDQLTALRHELHKYPELSGHEVQTGIRLSRFLSTCNPDRLITRLGGTGIAAVFRGSEAGPRVMIRCEMDALPMEDTTHRPYRSSIQGTGHQCGHDGHMAIVCGVGSLLANQRPAKGSVVLLFQPAEETGEGADRILRDPVFKEIEPDAIFALHNLPGYDTHQVVVKPGDFTASVNSIIIRLTGEKSHAAEPMHGNNPADAVAAIIESFRQTEVRNPDSPDYALLTPVYIQMGSIAYGVSADEAEIHYTLRSRNEERLKKLQDFAEQSVRRIAEEHKLACSLAWTQHFLATQNDPALVQLVIRSADRLGLATHTSTHPFSWGEDFGLFAEKYPSVMFGLGAGMKSPSLHQSDYDFPDELIDPGVKLFHAIVQEMLEED